MFFLQFFSLSQNTHWTNYSLYHNIIIINLVFFSQQLKQAIEIRNKYFPKTKLFKKILQRIQQISYPFLISMNIEERKNYF